MTQPYKYNTYVKSEIGEEHELYNGDRIHGHSKVQHEGHFNLGSFRSIDEAPSKLSIKSKFNELLDLCKSENRDLKNQFRNVVGAEKDILEILRSEFSRQQTPNHRNNEYVRSNVQNFPSPNDYQHRFNQQNYPGNQQNYPGNQQNYPGNFEAAPAMDYSNHQQSMNEKAAFLRSKVQDLAEENRQLRQYASRAQRIEEDPQIMQLQREISRLRALIPRYEAEIAKMGTDMNRNRMMDLLEQGEIIRQNTIAMLKGGNSNYSGGEEAEFLAELESMRRKCKELEEENKNLKRMSRGTDNTGNSRTYY